MDLGVAVSSSKLRILAVISDIGVPKLCQGTPLKTGPAL